MKIAKVSNYKKFSDIESAQAHAQDVDTDLQSIILGLQGRIRFGNSGNEMRGENISGEWELFTSASTQNAEVVITHGLGAKPEGFILTGINANGVVYKGPTPWDADYAYFSCSTPSALVSVFLLK